MRSIQPPLSAPASTVNRNRPRRRPDLTLPLPHRDPSLAVPLPLPPTSAPSSSTTSSLLSAPPLNFSELDRMNRIGSGSGGTVYKVVHRPTGKYYALKVIYGNHEDSVRRQICREIEILRDVDNLNVVKCHDMFDHAGEIQVLLEYMDGGSLEGTHINHEPTLADLTRQILSGICYLHSKKIVHRDIKPSNLLVNSRKQVKIADFGVSRILAQTMDPCNSSVGTIAYMSPERINTDLNQGMYDGYAGDIWSLGVSILEFYMGRFPFAVGRGGDWASLMCAICMSQPPEAPATVSREFRDFIACCLQRDPGRRWTASRLLRHPFVMQNNGGGGGHGNQKNGVGYPEDYVKVAVIADPQLMDKTSLHLAPKSLAMEIAQFYTDIFMRRAFLASVLPFKPDVILFLGDYFDGGPTLSDEEWQESFSRLRHIFDLDMLERTNNVQVYYIPGNHDIGYSALHSHLPKVFRRYEKVFGTRNYLFKVGEVDFIAIDAQTLDGHPQENLTSATWNFIKNVSRDSSSAPRILLTHIPLYRPDGTSCGLYRSSEIINQRVSLYGHNQEIMYQNYITEEKTKYILDSIRPVFILSGHDHDQCTVTHISKYGPVTEQTLGTISWQQGNLYPSFMLLSARNYTFSNASSGEDAILTHLCFLPVQTHIYIWYICQFVLTLLVVLLWPTSGLHFLRHVGEFMGHIKSIICCNIFKGVAKKKSEEENCEYEMIWDAEGSMHLIKRTLKATATSSSEKGTMERGNAVMRSTAKKQIRQEIDVSMPLDVNVHVELDTMVKLAHRASKSKMKMVVQRLVRTLRVLTVVAAVNLPIYMMLLFKDWIDK